MRQAGEAGIAGVVVTLTGTDAAGAAITRTATTDSRGNYSFVDLLAAGVSGYTVTEQAAQPFVSAVTTLNGKTAAGSTGGSATAPGSTPGSTPGAISGVALAAGAYSTDNRFGAFRGRLNCASRLRSRARLGRRLRGRLR